MTNMMIQNSIAPAPQKGNSSRKSSRDVDYSKYQIGAKALPNKGYMVRTPIWKAPFVAVKDTAKQVKSIGRALSSGKSDDFNIGCTNDVAMKAGGLAIAGYLATRRALPVRKGMEFVGAAAFFTSMALWPKVMALPVRAMYGFDPTMKYVDSYGRKKPCTDGQYEPWRNLMAPQEFDRIGDKMGVSKDMENRHEFVQDRMSKTIKQFNTLWMLSAGFMTPIMSALMCSGIEKGLNKLHQKHSTDKIEKKVASLGENLENADKIAEEGFDKKGFAKLGELLDAQKDKAVDNKFMAQLMHAIYPADTKGALQDLKLHDALKADLTKIVSDNAVADVSEFIGEIKVEAGGAKVELSKESIKKALTEGGANLNNNQAITPDSAKAITRRLTEVFKAQTKDAVKDQDVLVDLNEAFDSALKAKLDNPPRVLSAKKIETIKDVFKAVDAFRVKKGILDEFVIGHKIGDKEDSVVAREWQKASEGIMQALGFTDKELGEAKKAPARASEILESKMTEIAKDDSKYKATMERIAKVLGDFDSEMDKGFVDKATKMTETFYGDFAKKAKETSLGDVATYIAGDKQARLPVSAKRNFVENINNNINGARNSLYKVVQALDVFRRLEAKDSPIRAAIAEASSDKEFQESTIQAVKHSLLNATYGDHHEKLDIPEEKSWKQVIESLYPEKMDEETEKAFKGNEELLGKMKKQFTEIRNQIVDYGHRFRTGSQLPTRGTDEEKKAAKGVGDLIKQMKIGDILSSFAKKTSEQMHNTKTWKKIFGGIGAGVAGITLISTLFLGKIKEPAAKKKEVANG